MQDVYDMRFYLQAIIDYFSSCKPELGVTDVHWSDDDPNGIAIVTKNDLIVLNGECFPGLGGSKPEDNVPFIRNDITCVSVLHHALNTGVMRNSLNSWRHAERLDAYFAVNGWRLQEWINPEDNSAGYQLYFGDGVQVDNQYEYGFPHLLELDDLIHTLRKWKVKTIEKYQGTIYHNSGNEEDMEICPVCGGSIEPYDGEDNGYGELHLNWTCESCGSKGYAKIDTHNDNAFDGHEVDEEATDYHVSAAVDGHVNVFVKATGEELAKKRVDQVINEMDFGPLTSIDWEITDVCKA